MWRRAALAPLLLAVIFAATGWLYVVGQTGVPGPKVGEALPLDELARRSSVPLPMFVAVWLAAGLALGAAARWARLQRTVAVAAFTLATGFLLYVAAGLSFLVTRQVSARAALHSAERLGSVYLASVLVGLAVAVVALPRAPGRRAPAVVALVVAAAGALEVLHAILPGASDSGLVRSLTPDAAGPLSRAAGCFAGIALLFAARGLARRRRRAWEVAVAVASLSVLLHVLRGFSHGTTVSAAVLILLVARRHDFPLPGDEQTRFQIVRRIVLSIGAIAAYGTLALWANRLDADQPFTPRFAAREIAGGLLGLHLRGSPHLTGSFGQWFPLSLFLIGIGATVWVVSGWLAPWRHRVRQEAAERAQVERLVREWGADTLAPFTLRQDKSYFLDPAGAAFVAYRVVGGVAIVSGDPVGESERFGPLLDLFLAHAHERDWRVAILGASERWLDLYRERRLQVLYHGDEAVVDTAAFDLEGRPIRKVRQSVHRLQRAGYTVAVLRPSEVGAGLRLELEAIADAWRGGQPERGFVMALDRLDALGDDDAVFVIGLDGDGVAQGFLHFAVVHAAAALSLSSMPRVRATTPNGFNEWLIVESLLWAREHGYRRVSLNFSPFAALLGGDMPRNLSRELQRRALLTVTGHFQLDNLLAFNRKFFPAWEHRFLVYERRTDLPRVGIAALAAEAYLPFQTARR